MITTAVKEFARSLARAVALGLARTGVTPNGLTIIGLLLNVVVAAVLAAGYLLPGGLLLLLAGLFDMLDGALAKATGQASKFGAFLDSTLDRYSEIIVFFGLLWHLQRVDDQLLVALIYAAAVGSLMVSYARARAESLGYDAEVGLLARPERIILLAAGLMVAAILPIVLWVLAVLTNITAIHRIIHVWRLDRGR